VSELATAMARLKSAGTRFFVLGGGTNSLVLDDHFPGTVIILSRFRGVQVSGTEIRAEAGVTNTELSELAYSQRLSGIEWMNRLPGQLGGTVRMNARCYGGEISQVVTRVETVTPAGEIKVYDRMSEVFRGYKDTIFMDNSEIITAATLSLLPGDSETMRNKMDFCSQDREQKGQFSAPSCGCVFKNNYQVGIPSGKLLELAGVKGLKHGGAAVSPYHANFVFNHGASSGDIIELALEMRDRVFKNSGVWLEFEMEILGDLPADLAEKIKRSPGKQ
jgi:UDP-N-acetylmuramate dehydrogenase